MKPNSIKQKSTSRFNGLWKYQLLKSLTCVINHLQFFITFKDCGTVETYGVYNNKALQAGTPSTAVVPQLAVPPTLQPPTHFCLSVNPRFKDLKVCLIFTQTHKCSILFSYLVKASLIWICFERPDNRPCLYYNRSRLNCVHLGFKAEATVEHRKIILCKKKKNQHKLLTISRSLFCILQNQNITIKTYFI